MAAPRPILVAERTTDPSLRSRSARSPRDVAAANQDRTGAAMPAQRPVVLPPQASCAPQSGSLHKIPGLRAHGCAPHFPDAAKLVPRTEACRSDRRQRLEAPHKPLKVRVELTFSYPLDQRLEDSADDSPDSQVASEGDARLRIRRFDRSSAGRPHPTAGGLPRDDAVGHQFGDHERHLEPRAAQPSHVTKRRAHERGPGDMRSTARVAPLHCASLLGSAKYSNTAATGRATTPLRSNCAIPLLAASVVHPLRPTPALNASPHPRPSIWHSPRSTSDDARHVAVTKNG
jgi:hypothetical protein